MNEQEARARQVYAGNALADVRGLIAKLESGQEVDRTEIISVLMDAEAVILEEFGETSQSFDRLEEGED
jgi:hypothetical protein